MITIADLKQRLEQFDDDAMIVFRADTERELYDDSALIDVRERLDFEPVSLMLANDVDYWELDMAVAGGAALIVAENVPGGHRTYLDLARWLSEEHDYRTTVSSAGAWEVGAPHRRERIMLVAARRRFEPRSIEVIRQTVPDGLSRTASIRLAGNTVVRLQARLMLQRGLTAINNERNL